MTKGLVAIAFFIAIVFVILFNIRGKNIRPYAIYIYGANSGNVVINGAGGTGYPALQPGDKLQIPAGTFTGYSMDNITGTLADSIIIEWMPGAKIDNNFCGFCFNEWRNVHYVKMTGLVANRTGVGIVDMRADCDNIRFTNYRFDNIGPVANFSSNFAVNIANTFNAGDVFNNTLATTFHNIRFDNGYIHGFKNTNIFRLGKWDANNYTNLILNFQFDNNTCVGFVNEGNNTTPIIEARSSYGLKIYNNIIDSIPRSTGQNTHNSVFRVIGNGRIYNNKFTNRFANCIRAMGVRLNSTNPGVVATGATDSLYIYNNIDSFSTCYPSFEVNPNLEAGGSIYNYINNNSGGYARFCGSIIEHNGTLKTTIDSYNNYHGALADIFGYSSGEYGTNVPGNNFYISVKNNYIAEQAVSGNSGYNNLTVFGNGVFGFTHDTSGNKKFTLVSDINYSNASKFVPSTSSLLYNAAVSSFLSRSLDVYGTAVPQAGIADVGPVEAPFSAAVIRLKKGLRTRKL